MPEPLAVAVIGARGRMGVAACEAIRGADGLELVGEFDLLDDATPKDPVALAAAVREAGAAVAVDFTVPTAVEANVLALIDAGLHAVVGTTGWTPDSLAGVAERLTAVNATRGAEAQLGVLIAPNFALSAVLAMRFAALAAPFFESAEVVELHHPDKVDAPSGTAKSTAERIAAARSKAGLGPMPDATRAGFEARGLRVAEVPVHAVRLRGLVAHEEVLFGNPGEMLTIRTDSFDRISFMPGVLLGVREVASRPGLTVGLENYLAGL